MKIPSKSIRNLFVPSSLRGGDHVCGNIGNIIIRKTSAESRHGILSISDLCHDRALFTTSGKVLIKCILLKGLLWHDNILSASVARGAVGVEDLLSGFNISSERGGDSNSSGHGNTGSGGLNSSGDLEVLGDGPGRGGGNECGKDSKLHFDVGIGLGD
mmetsp:Transcript_18887/g.33946  ORF Transcript_18887/g.33946 Transcript_18887/m.33946 type:complete len:158 (+) Transcript_18887:228-701(+)